MTTSRSSQEECLGQIRAQQWKLAKATIASQQFQEEITYKPLSIPGTLLHVACSFPRVPTDIITAILHAHPRSVYMEDEDGNLPIHLLCEFAIRPDLVNLLLTSCPETSFTPSPQQQELPFYILVNHCIQQLGLQAASDLISSFPPSLIYNDHVSVLHQIGIELLPETICLKVLEVFPQICKIQNNCNTLLHIICSHQDSTPSLVQRIIDLSPESCAIMDDYGNIPLHLVNSDRHSVEIIQKLVQYYPQGLLNQNRYGQIPLMSPLIKTSSIRVKEILRCCSSDRETLTSLLHMKNQSGMNLVIDYFYAFQRQLSNLVGQGIISMKDLSKHGGTKTYTRHIANDLESLLHLMRVAVYNDVEYALESPHQESFWTAFPVFVKTMLHHSPDIACHQDSLGNLPLHVVARHTIQQLQPTHCSYCHTKITGPYLWLQNSTCCCQNCDCNSRFTNQCSPLVEYQGSELIKDVLAANPSAALVKDSEGNLPLHLSLKSGKTWSTGVSELIEVAMSAVAVQDKETNLFPFMLAAEGKIYDKELGIGQKLTTTYELLRAGVSQF